MLRLTIAMFLLLSGCASYPTSRDATNAVLWVQTSAEYELALRQSYLMARRQLDLALEGNPESPAVVMDLDETVLDNSAFEARLIADDRPFDIEAWREWLSGVNARALPGAVELVEHVRQQGAELYFITNRHERYREATLETLRTAGLVEEENNGERLLMRGQRPDWTRDKTSRRELVAQSHSVVLVMGNDLNDFVDCAELDPPARHALLAQHGDRFGRDWIMIPSPNWGSWLEALHDHRNDLDDGEMRRRHLRWLRLD